VNIDALTAERIGLTWLRSAVAPVGAFGRRHDDAIAPYGPGDEARALAEIEDVVALAQRLDRDGVARLRAALRDVPEPSAIVARARAGDPLNDVDFYELGRFVDALAALARAWDAAGGEPERRPPLLEPLRELLAPGRSGAEFYLADAFGPGLAAARASVAQAEERYEARREAIAARVRDALGVDPAGEEFVLLRDVYDGALPDDVVVVRETPTYRAAMLRVVAPERDDALARLAAEEESARRALAERIAREAGTVTEATRALGALDRLLARVAFAQRWGACVPELTGERITFANATFAPLAETLARHGRRYTRLALSLDRAAVVTGPNMGGKSAALATAGFLCACASAGVPPPAETASFPLLASVVWIGGEAPDRERLLSSYAAEVTCAQDALAAANPRALVLLDELARTTGPREGRALLVAFIEAFGERGAFTLVATHFDDVAEAAAVAHLRIAGLGGRVPASLGARGLEDALDAIGGAMDYRIVPAGGASAESDALELARLLGVEAALIERARALLGSQPQR
jgi:hypothetical protein